MKICVLQPPYAHKPEESPVFMGWLYQELDALDASVDLVVLPEYSNAPSVYPNPADYQTDLERYTAPLRLKVEETCRRCRTMIAVNMAVHSAGEPLRNTTLLFDREGRVAGTYLKQHVFPTEPVKK